MANGTENAAADRSPGGRGAAAAERGARCRSLLSAFLVLSVVTFPACERTPVATEATTDEETVSRQERARQQSCERMLETILEGIAVDRIGSEVDIDTETADLNAWRNSCVKNAEDLSGDPAARRQAFPQFADAIEREVFDNADIQHLQSAIFSRAVAEQALGDGELPAAVRSMRLLAQHLAQIPPEVGPVAVPLKQLWLLGLASQEERAWLFVELLRQLRIDAAVMTMPAAAGQPPYLLVGVPLEGEVYLFDPALSMPVPAMGDDSALVETPLTLTQATASDAAFRQLDTEDAAYPVTSARLKSARLSYVLSPEYAAPRMAILQDRLPKDAAATIYEGLSADDFAETGLIGRLAAGFDRDEADFTIWEFPLAVMSGRVRPSQPVSQLVTARNQVLVGPWRMLVFQGPDGRPVRQMVPSTQRADSVVREFEMQADAQRQEAERQRREAERLAAEERGETVTEEMRGQPDELPVPVSKRSLVKSLGVGRALHLVGRVPESLRIFLRSRGTEGSDPRNTMGASDASYWAGLGQDQQGKPEIAERTYQTFLKTAPPQGMWTAVARRAYGSLLAQRGDYEAAVEVIDGPSPDPAMAVLAKRWRQLGGLTDGGRAAGEASLPNADKELAKGAKSNAAVENAVSPGSPTETPEDGGKMSSEAKAAGEMAAEDAPAEEKPAEGASAEGKPSDVPSVETDSQSSSTDAPPVKAPAAAPELLPAGDDGSDR